MVGFHVCIYICICPKKLKITYSATKVRLLRSIGFRVSGFRVLGFLGAYDLGFSFLGS